MKVKKVGGGIPSHVRTEGAKKAAKKGAVGIAEQRDELRKFAKKVDGFVRHLIPIVAFSAQKAPPDKHSTRSTTKVAGRALVNIHRKPLPSAKEKE